MTKSDLILKIYCWNMLLNYTESYNLVWHCLIEIGIVQTFSTPGSLCAFIWCSKGLCILKLKQQMRFMPTPT
jgi:hypothetical protein